MKVLISVLGRSPKKYREVNWYLKSPIQSSIRARMPAQAIAQAKKVDHVLLLIPDSLGAGNVDTYTALQQSAQGLLTDDLLSGDGAMWHPIVLPSRYSSSVMGDVRDFYRAAIFFLARWLMEHLEHLPEDEPVEFYLDASTGLNVLQLFTYRAVREISGALAYFREVTLQVYNADPVAPNTEQAEIFLTEEQRPVHASISRVRVDGTPRLVDLYDAEGQHPGREPNYRNLRNTLARQWPGRDVAAFLNAVHYGIPLGIVHWFTEQPKQVLLGLERIYQYVLGQSRQRGQVFLRSVSLGLDVIPYALGALLSHQLQQRWHFFTPELKRNGATYEQLRSLMEQMYRHHPVILNRFQAERTIQPENLQSPQYPILLAQCGSFTSTCSEDSIDRRNFFAHAGFERCAVEVDNINGIVLLRFAFNTIQSVQRFLNSAN